MTKWHQAILSKLDGYSGFDIEFDDDRIFVCCKNAESFDLSFHVFGSEFQVSFDGWHGHFQTEEEALNCFAFGLSQECRLKVTKRGAKAVGLFRLGKMTLGSMTPKPV